MFTHAFFVPNFGAKSYKKLAFGFEILVPKFCTKNPLLNVDEIDTYSQFHQRFFAHFFHTNIISAAFSSYVLALSKILYEKCGCNTLMKLTPSRPCS